MLYSIEKEDFVHEIPHSSEYQIWRSRVPPEQFQRVWDELNSRIDVDEVHTAGWIPGNRWDGTVFEPLAIACDGDVVASGKFFGLIVWDVMLNRPEVWGFGRYEKDGVPIESMTYFKLRLTP